MTGPWHDEVVVARWPVAGGRALMFDRPISCGCGLSSIVLFVSSDFGDAAACLECHELRRRFEELWLDLGGEG